MDKTIITILDALTPLYQLFSKINSIIYSLGNITGFITGLIILLSGILLAYWGYKLKKAALFVIGLIFGISLGIIIGEYLNGDIKLIIILCIIFGVSFSFLSYFLYFTAVFIIGIIIGASLGLIIGVIIGDSIITLILIIILALIGGILSIKVNKVVFIILTAYYGYLLFRVGIYSINIFNIDRIIEEVISLIVLLTGLIFQFIDNSSIKEKIEETE